MEHQLINKRNIELTFVNVAELAAETKRRKLLEDEAKMYNERTYDELSAAVALIMMRYQPISEAKMFLNSNVTPKDKHINLKLSSKFPVVPKKTLDNAKFKALDLQTSDKSSDDSFTKQTAKKLKIEPISHKSSLLTSCRNILKEFLSQGTIH